MSAARHLSDAGRRVAPVVFAILLVACGGEAGGTDDAAGDTPATTSEGPASNGEDGEGAAQPTDAPGSDETTTLTLAEPASFVESLPLYIAMDEGMMAEHGLEIEIVTLSSGGSAHSDAVLSGDAWGFIGGLEHVLFSNARGDAQLLGLVSMADPATYYLVGPPDAEAPPTGGLGDLLRGKRIATLPFGATPNTVLRWQLIEEGLDPDADVELQEGSVDAIFSAMARGDVDFATVFDPILDIGQLEQTWGEPLVNWAEVVGPIGNAIVGVSTDTLENDQETVNRFLDALAEGREVLHSDPETAERVLTERFDLPPEVATAIIERNEAVDGFSEDGVISQEAFTQVVELVSAVGLYDGDLGYEDVVVGQAPR